MSSRKPKRKRWAYQTLVRRHGPACIYCGSEMTEPDPSRPEAPTMRTIDHFHPKALGGTNRLANLVLACATCNQA